MKRMRLKEIACDVSKASRKKKHLGTGGHAMRSGQGYKRAAGGEGRRQREKKNKEALASA